MRGLPSLDLIGGPAEGLTVIVTGPTSGIGRETAAELARRGATGVWVPLVLLLPECCMSASALFACCRSCCRGGLPAWGTRHTLWVGMIYTWMSRPGAPPAQQHSPVLAHCLAAEPPCAAVVLACRSIPKGEALKKELEEQAAAGGQPAPKLEVRWKQGAPGWS